MYYAFGLRTKDLDPKGWRRLNSFYFGNNTGAGSGRLSRWSSLGEGRGRCSDQRTMSGKSVVFRGAREQFTMAGDEEKSVKKAGMAGKTLICQAKKFEFYPAGSLKPRALGT